MSRGISPVVGVPILVGITVILGAAVGVVTLGIPTPATPQPPLVSSVTASAETNQITFVNEGGREVDVRDLSLHIELDGVPLSNQPPIPFFSATGFKSGPTGAFNSASSPMWNPGERAAIRVATTNSPQLTENAMLTVRLSIDGTSVAVLETRVS